METYTNSLKAKDPNDPFRLMGFDTEFTKTMTLEQL